MATHSTAPVVSYGGVPHTILVVDDEAAILRAIARLLRREYNVLTASNVERAVELLRLNQVHLVMSDQRMPSVSGVEFLTYVKEHFPHCVRILFTEYTETQSAIDAVNSGSVYCYIPKPWDPEELRLLIAQACERYELARERRLLLAQLQETNEILERRNSELESVNAKLKDMDRLKTVFMEVISHELNTPIAIIQGYAALMSRGQGDAAPTRDIQAIQKSATRIENITTKIFKVLESNDPAVRLETNDVALSELLEPVRSTVGPFLRQRSQVLNVKCPADLRAELDVEKIQDALINLLMNAIKFSSNNSTIHLTVRPESDGVLIEIADQGIGIATEDISEIFHPFFGTFDSIHHSSGIFEFGKRGIGLGLAIVKNFVELHGGKVDVASKSGEGSTFWIWLPRRRRPTAPLHDSPEQDQPG